MISPNDGRQHKALNNIDLVYKRQYFKTISSLGENLMNCSWDS